MDTQKEITQLKEVNMSLEDEKNRQKYTLEMVYSKLKDAREVCIINLLFSLVHISQILGNASQI